MSKMNNKMVKLIPKLLRWQHGRQESGYDKMLLATLTRPIPFDCYLIRYPIGSSIKPHTDPVKDRRHFRLNIVVKPSPIGGEFLCDNPLFTTTHIKFFRPDISKHSVTRVEGGSRYVVSIGWLWGRIEQ